MFQPLGCINLYGLGFYINSISTEDIQQFYDRHYTPTNMSIVAIGSLKPDQFASLLEKSPFGSFKPGQRTPLPSPVTQVDPPSETKHILRVSEHFANPPAQSRLETSVALPGTINWKAGHIARNVLYDVFFKEIREKRGWTYGFQVSWFSIPEAHKMFIRGDSHWDGLGEIESVVDGVYKKQIA